MKLTGDDDGDMLRLEVHSEDLAGKKLDDLTDEELHTVYAYYMWQDGADWSVVKEMLVDETLDRQQMIKTLKEHFKYEENHDKAK